MTTKRKRKFTVLTILVTFDGVKNLQELKKIILYPFFYVSTNMELNYSSWVLNGLIKSEKQEMPAGVVIYLH
jgi:hypothetical protein